MISPTSINKTADSDSGVSITNLKYPQFLQVNARNIRRNSFRLLLTKGHRSFHLFHIAEEDSYGPVRVSLRIFWNTQQVTAIPVEDGRCLDLGVHAEHIILGIAAIGHR